MSSDAIQPVSGPDPARPRPFQFGLFMLLKAVTVFSIACGLAAWDRTFGGGTAILLVGSWLTWESVRAGRRRWGYYIASFTLGAPLFMIVLGLLALQGLNVHPNANQIVVFLFAAICTAALAGGAVSRRRIRQSGFWKIAVGGIQAAYVASIVFLWISQFTPSILAMPPSSSMGSLGEVLGTLCFLPFLSVVATTVLLPVIAPLAVACAYILHRIDPEPEQLAE